MSVATAIIAVATATPSVIAMPASSLRRAWWRDDSYTMRGNIFLLFLLEVMSAGRDVGLGDDARVVGDLGFQRNRIAASGHAHRLRIDRRGAVFADHSVRPFIEADAATDLAGVEEGGDFTVRFLVEPEADFDTAFPGFEAVEFAVVNLFQRDGDFAIDEADFRGGR